MTRAQLAAALGLTPREASWMTLDTLQAMAAVSGIPASDKSGATRTAPATQVRHDSFIAATPTL